MSTQTLTPFKAEVGFVKPQEEFVLLNSSTEAIEFRYDGYTMTVPARDQVLDDPRHQAARDSEGNIIRGSIVVHDIPNYRTRLIRSDDGLSYRTEPYHWIARDALRNALGIDPKSGTIASLEAHRGLSLLPTNPTPVQVAEADAAGKIRAEKWEEHKALSILASFQAKVDAEKSRGLSASIPSEEVLDAKVKVDHLNAKRRREYAKKYNIRLTDETFGVGEDRQVSTPDRTIQDEDELLERLTEKAEQRVLAKFSKEMQEYFTKDSSGTYRKRKVAKSQRKTENKSSRAKTLANSKAIQTPED